MYPLRHQLLVDYGPVLPETLAGRVLVLLSLLDIAIFIVTLHAQLHVLTGRPLSGAKTLALPRMVDTLNMDFVLGFPKVFLFSVSAGTLSLPCLHVTCFHWTAKDSTIIT